MNQKSGFTLIEILVVMAIISILMAVLVVSVFGSKEKAFVNKTKGVIQRIETALEMYHSRFNAYPPSNIKDGSQNLHYFLGKQWDVCKPGTIGPGGPNDCQKEKVQPMMQPPFKDGEVSTGDAKNPDNPGYILDGWGENLTYVNPGVKHAGRDNSRFVDMESGGPDMDLSTKEDNVDNFKRK